MRSSRPLSRLLAAIAVVAAAALSGHAQQPPPERAPGTLKEAVRAVLVDVVVRDRRGDPVRGLTASDFQILEDGVPQTIGSFTPVFGGVVAAPTGDVATRAPERPAGTRPAAPGTVSVGPGVTAMVFHGLSPEARRRALRAAESYVGDAQETSNYIGVFGVDLGLTPLVPFTRNGYAVRQALARWERGGAPGFNSPELQQQRADAEQQAASAGQTAATAQAAGGPGAAAAIGGSPGEAQLAQMEADMVTAFERMDRDQQGYIATDALSAIVSTLGRLPGRKSLILFSEGIALPDAVHRLFLGVIDAANRANVSIYAIDAAGLRTESDQARIRDRVNQAAGFGINTGYSADSGGSPYTRGLEANEDVLRSDTAATLGQLAQGTGGLLFNSTNNLRPAFDRIDEDLRNYYLLGYTPTNDTYDGRFRNIEVKVNRPNLTVAARRGYYAVRDPGGVAVNAWEAPAIAAVDATPVPNAFPIRAQSMFFPERGRPGLVPVVVEFKTAPLTFQPAADGKTYTSDFTVLVRFVDQDGGVVRKLSQHYQVTGAAGEIEGARRGEIIFYRESELPPGVYTMETAVHDALAGRSSVRFSTVEVPKLDPAQLRVSSLILVKRGEKVDEKERRADNPLLVNDTVLFPNLGEPLSKAAAREVGFFFTIYPVPGGPAPDAAIELLQNGQFMARVPLSLSQPDAAGRIQQVGRLPLEPLAPGTYELRAIVQEGNAQMIRSTLLRVTD